MTLGSDRRGQSDELRGGEAGAARALTLPVDPPSEELVDVLFIEGDPAVAEMYKLKLELDGYRVVVTPAGDGVLDQARQRVPDIIFVEMKRPDEESVALLTRLRSDEITRNVPVVIVSSLGASELSKAGLRLGILDYLVNSYPAASNFTRSLESWA